VTFSRVRFNLHLAFMNLQPIEDAADEFMQSLYDGVGKAITSKDVTRYGPVNASGRLLRSREIRKDKLNRLLLVNRYAYSLVYGRKPGTPPPVSAIRDWLKSKGLDLNEYAVQKSIAKKGNVIYQTYHGSNDGLFSEVVNDQVLDAFTEKLAGLWAAEVSSELMKGFKI
jgi:hypothetical protein